MGSKMGLQGVDNGRMWFDGVRVPREDMLDAFAAVSPEGVYSSTIPSVSQRFGTVVGGLTTGEGVGFAPGCLAGLGRAGWAGGCGQGRDGQAGVGRAGMGADGMG
jgi:hypothetical protein